jgi:hypothetical protein
MNRRPPVVRCRALYVYETEPIDLGWRLLLSVDAMREILAKEESEFLHGVEGYYSADFWAIWEQVQQVARSRGWDGTLRETPRVFFLPDPDPGEFACGFVWKQDNNGTTFVVSPKRLPWLERAHS